MNYRAPLYYGFVVALCASVLMILLVGLDMLGPDAVLHDREMIGGTVLFLMIYLFLLFGVYFVLKNEKDRKGGTLRFRKAVVLGMLTSLSAGIFSVLFTILFYEVVYPEYVSDLLVSLGEKMEVDQIPKERIQSKLQERATYYSTGTQSVYSFIGNFTTGMAFTLLLSFFLKNKK